MISLSGVERYCCRIRPLWLYGIGDQKVRFALQCRVCVCLVQLNNISWFDGTTQCEADDRLDYSLSFTIPVTTRKIIRRAVITFRPNSGVHKFAVATSPWRLFCTVARDICGHQRGTCLMWPFWWLEYWRGVWIFFLGGGISPVQQV